MHSDEDERTHDTGLSISIMLFNSFQVMHHSFMELFKGHFKKKYFTRKYLIGARQIIWLAPNNHLARTKSFGLNQLMIWRAPNH